MRTKKGETGQSLVEVLVALAVALLVILALVWATTIAIRNATFSKHQVQATKFAQEAMEWIRSERDRDWDELDGRDAVDPGNRYCLNTLSWPAAPSPLGCSSGEYLGTIFQREAVLIQLSDRIKVQVEVSWQEAGQTHESQLTSYFTNW